MNTQESEVRVTSSNRMPSALEFASLIDSVPELTEAVVSAAYRGALAGSRRRDDVAIQRIEEHLSDGAIVETREDVMLPQAEDELVTLLGKPIEGRPIVKPTRTPDAAALAGAVDRFVTLAGRLPHLGVWEDRQAVWNLLPGTRPCATPITSCDAAHAARTGGIVTGGEGR